MRWRGSCNVGDRAMFCFREGRRCFSSSIGGATSLAQAVSALEQQLFAESSVYPPLLQRCGREKSLALGKRIHAHLARSGFKNDTFLGNLLVQMYWRCSSIAEASRVFESIPRKNAFSWNIMVAAYAHCGLCREAFAVFDRMWNLGVRPVNKPVLVLLVRASSSLESLRSVHSRIESEGGLTGDGVLGTAFVSAYGRFGRPEEGRRVFDSMGGCRDAICWTAMIAAYAQNMKGREALEIFKQMECPADEVAFVSAIDACSVLRDFNEGAWLHCRALQEGFLCHILATSLVTLYGRCGRVDLARQVFEQHRSVLPAFAVDVVAWNAMIAAYVQNGHHTEAIDMFEGRMDVTPNAKTYATVLDACANTGALEKGKAIHGRVSSQQIASDVIVGTALLSMYGRCGLIEAARSMFRSMCGRDPVAWTAMISAYAQNGHCTEALDLFWKMIEEDLQPDCVTYVGVLSACSHAGLLQEGSKHFLAMRHDYEIEPRMEHFGCMIDLLGRTGQLAEAEELMRLMPFDPNEVAWTAMLNACTLHGDVERGLVAAEALLKLGGGNAAEPYIAMASLLSSTGREADAQMVRMRLAESGMKKCSRSSIEVANAVHVFSAESCELHPKYSEIVSELERLNSLMKEATGVALQKEFKWTRAAEDDEDGLFSGDHTEKLALGLGLLSGASSLHIVKNERMCGDCHVGFKTASKVLVSCAITVRDTRRIHKFENGLCSCGDYW